ncbi:MAG: acyl-CoA dehydrogenase family protein [bacterium]
MADYRGGAFMMEPVGSRQIFIPEHFTEEQRMMAKTASDFVEKEVVPRAEEIDEMKPGLLPSLIKKAAELGLCSIDIPEKYDGLDQDKATSMLVAEKMAQNGTFSCAVGAHTGIGTLPIVYFGNEEQKKKYLPLLGSGEKLSAYALTEPTAGSDAMSIRTKATLSEDGKYYILNGTKQFITNAGFADMFIVYAKVDGDKFTGFIVDRNAEGITIGPEEKKMGIKGSSTTQIILENVKVPVEDTLYEIGKGHKIAFNILNIGRFKLGIGAIGGSKNLLGYTVKYAKQREQFNTPLAQFGAIKDKLARMTTRIYAGESMAYRVAGLMDESIAKIDKNLPDAQQKIIDAIEEYALEDSIIKVYGSECLDFVADEAVQIYGGYGYTAEYPAEKSYRDSRINRIFEGTNEINRMLIPGTLLKRGMKGQLPLMDYSGKVFKELTSGSIEVQADGVLADAVRAAELAKKATMYSASVAIQKYMANLQKEQEVLIMMADMMIAVYAMDSTLCRVLQLVSEKGADKCAVQIDVANCVVADCADIIATIGRRLLGASASGDELKKHIEAFDRGVPFFAYNTVAGRRNIADRIIEDEKYNL